MPEEVNEGLCTKCVKPYTEDNPKQEYMGVSMHLKCVEKLKSAQKFTDPETEQITAITKDPEKIKPVKLPGAGSPGRPRGSTASAKGGLDDDPNAWTKLTDQQLLNIEVYSTLLNGAGITINPSEVFKHWNTDPDHLYKSGARPDERLIASYMATKQYKGNMEQRGVTDHSSLTVQQILVLQTVTDVRDTRPVSKKLAQHHVPRAKYNQWLRNPEFAKQIKKLGDNAIQDAIQHGKVALAQKVEGGDLNAIKYLYEMTGTYNPNDSNKVADNLGQLIQIILEVVQSEVGDPELLSRIQNGIALQSNRLRGGNSTTRSINTFEIE